MRVLALDTTRAAGSMALVEDDRIVAERRSDPVRSHAERLPGDLLSLLDAADVPLSAVDVFAVGAGPGSLTGLRIGVATIQGLAFVGRKRIAPVSALEALAQQASVTLAPGDLVAAWMDAHRRDVFSALYRVVDAPPFTRRRLDEIDSPAVGDPAVLLARWVDRFGVPVIVAGDGASAYADRIGDAAQIVDPPLLAGPIGLIAVDRAHTGETVAPADVQPLYIRRPDAETARDKVS